VRSTLQWEAGWSAEQAAELQRRLTSWDAAVRQWVEAQSSRPELQLRRSFLRQAKQSRGAQRVAAALENLRPEPKAPRWAIAWVVPPEAQRPAWPSPVVLLAEPEPLLLPSFG
jgi:hypothetical protein